MFKFNTFSSVFIVGFEQANVSWVLNVKHVLAKP